MDSQAHGAGSKRSRDETVDPNAEESSVWESFLDQIGMERDLNEEPEQECEGDERSEERHKNITDYERKYIGECIEEVSHISSSAQAWKRFDTSNVKSWLFWPRWLAGAEKEAFYARAVGLWYPAKWFPEMRNTIYCPRCETQVDVENGTWMKPEQAREVVSFERTWLLLGREYRCPNARCGYNFRNTTVEFLKSCPELTRHRFPIIIRNKLAIERTLAQFYYPLWIRSGQIPLDASLGAHVRNFEKTREICLITSLTTLMGGYSLYLYQPHHKLV